MLSGKRTNAYSFQCRRKHLKFCRWTWAIVAFALFTGSVGVVSANETLDLDILEQEEESIPVNTSSPNIILSPDIDSANHTLSTPTNDTVEIANDPVEVATNDTINTTNDPFGSGSHEEQQFTDQNDTVDASNDVAERRSLGDANLSNTLIDDYSHDDVGFNPPILLSSPSVNDDEVPSPAPNIGKVIEPSFISVNASKLDDMTAVDVKPMERERDVNETLQEVDFAVFVDGFSDDKVNVSSADLSVVSEQSISEQPVDASINRTEHHTTHDESGVDSVSNVPNEPVMGEAENHQSVMPTPLDDIVATTKRETTEGRQPNIESDAPKCYHCGIWGDSSVAIRRRKPNISVLQQLFEGEISLKDDSLSNRRPDMRDPFAGPDVSNVPFRGEKPTEPSLGDDTVDPSSMIRTVSNSLRSSENPSDSVPPASSGNDIVSGLDDIDNLFEGVDPPDELDVGADGASIQEVLMGSASRLVIKRISIAGRFLFRKANQARVFVVQKVGDAAKNSKLLENFRDDDGKIFLWELFHDANDEFAPLQWLRGDDGELIPIQWMESTGWGSALMEKVRNDNGETIRKSRKYVAKVAGSVRTNVVAMFFKVESFFDKLFEGPDLEDEDLDFKFYSDVSDDRARGS
jgi:hypothetical protein